MKHAFRRLGRSGLKVSTLGVGCMGFGPRRRWFGGAQAREADRIVGKALDAGVNFFDTADVYNDGVSEELLGRALGARRREAVVATKAFCRTGRGANDAGNSRQHLLDACDASLRRLKTDAIDLYQLHEWDAETPIEETMRALEDLVRWGKVRYVGCSNFEGWQLVRALWASDKNGWVRLESDQVSYSLLMRGIERDLRPVCEEQGVGVIAYSPLAGGWLSGKYLDGGTGRLSSPASAYPALDRRRAEPLARVLEKAAKACGRTPAQLALAWAASRPWVSVTLFGATTEAQLDENLGASAHAPAPDVLTILDRASDAVAA